MPLPIAQGDIVGHLAVHLENRTTDLAAKDLLVPKECFVSDAHAALERKLLANLPVVVAYASEISEPGQFLTREVLGKPLIIVRANDGHVASFMNICRHRGGKVEWEEAGSKRAFTCRYHGWSYKQATGELRSAPYAPYFESLKMECNGLIPVHVEEQSGLIWANLESGPTERQVPGYLGQYAQNQLNGLDLDGTEVYLSRSFTLPINWKLVVDGALDTSHPRFLHPDGVGKLLETNTYLWREHGRHGQLFVPRKRLSRLMKQGGPLKDDSRLFASNLFIYPNTLVITAPDHVEFWTVWPSNSQASESVTNIRFLARPDVLSDEMKQRLDRSWAILEDAAANEDWPMEAAIQRNAEASPDGSFLYGRHEATCQLLHRQLQGDIANLNGAGLELSNNGSLI
jgi:phenylpropionate dioxygenase-like ring-hydroxylating dioxygenase large terminal subunit